MKKRKKKHFNLHFSFDMPYFIHIQCLCVCLWARISFEVKKKPVICIRPRRNCCRTVASFLWRFFLPFIFYSIYLHFQCLTFDSISNRVWNHKYTTYFGFGTVQHMLTQMHTDANGFSNTFGNFSCCAFNSLKEISVMLIVFCVAFFISFLRKSQVEQNESTAPVLSQTDFNWIFQTISCHFLNWSHIIWPICFKLSDRLLSVNLIDMRLNDLKFHESQRKKSTKRKSRWINILQTW